MGHANCGGEVRGKVEVLDGATDDDDDDAVVVDDNGVYDVQYSSCNLRTY